VHLRLHAFGRGTGEFESQLRDALRGVEVEVRVDGVLPAEQVVEAFSSSHVALFVRGSISTRRGSGVAAIACGLPVIAYAGPETVAPITEAGVVLVPQGKETALGEALVRVLCDADFRTYLADRSRHAHQEYFGWAAIAASYVEALDKYGLSSSA
jgi:glycosyltransferase involved in cell wall biosynthesis